MKPKNKIKEIKAYALLSRKWLILGDECEYNDIALEDLFYERIYAVAEMKRRNFLEEKNKALVTKLKIIPVKITPINK